LPTEPFLKEYIRKEDGAVAVIFAMFTVILIGAMAISIDVGSWYLAQSKLQAEADLVATSAALNLDSGAEDPNIKARAAAERTAIGNGLSGAAVTGITARAFDFDTSTPINTRLKPPNVGIPNAVTAELERDIPVYFASLFLPEDHLTIRAEATAAKSEYAVFTLGSRLAQLHDTGALNSLLKSALGSNVKLQVLDYNALIGSEVNLLQFVDALATQVDLQAANYQDLLDASISTPQLLNAIIAALPETAAGHVAATSLANMISQTANDTLTIRKLINIEDGVTDLHVNDILDPINISALDILMASVEILNAKNHRIVKTPLSLNIPSIANVEMKLLIGERRIGSGWVTVGASGVTLHTAQIRMEIVITLDASIEDKVKKEIKQPALLGVEVKLPLYVEVASATVTLTSLNCSATEPSDVVARFRSGITPFQVNETHWSSGSKYTKTYQAPGGGGSHSGSAVAALYIGEFSNSVFTNTSQALSPNDLQPGILLSAKSQGLLSVQLLEFKIRGAIRIGESRESEVSFMKSEIVDDKGKFVSKSKTIGSSIAIGSLVSQLLNTNNLEITQPTPGLVGALLGLVLSIVDLLNSNVPNNLLDMLLSPVDAILDTVLDALGISIGEMDLTFIGASCGNVMLVK